MRVMAVPGTWYAVEQSVSPSLPSVAHSRKGDASGSVSLFGRWSVSPIVKLINRFSEMLNNSRK